MKLSVGWSNSIPNAFRDMQLELRYEWMDGWNGILHSFVLMQGCSIVRNISPLQYSNMT